MIFLGNESKFEKPKSVIEDMIADYLVNTIDSPEVNGIIYTSVIDFEENQRINSKIHFKDSKFVKPFNADWSIYKAENEGQKYIFYIKNEWLLHSYK